MESKGKRATLLPICAYSMKLCVILISDLPEIFYHKAAVNSEAEADAKLRAALIGSSVQRFGCG